MEIFGTQIRKIYDETFFNTVSKKSAGEIWEKEKHKDSVAFDEGYSVLKIWESDYKENKETCINLCISYLK